MVSRKQAADGSWGAQSTALQGTNAGSGYGDAATVVDRTTGKVLMLNASGTVGYGSSTLDNPICITKSVSSDDGATWKSTDITYQMYNTCFASTYGGIWSGMFFSSGRICQSRLIKVGDYYRIYAALCARTSYSNASIVAYSDDFGDTWKALGGVYATPVDGGDEAKIEELPNGNVLISSRVNGNTGRYFNIFSYTNTSTADGSWGTRAYCSFDACNSCNGEILLVPAIGTDSKYVYVALQSVALGSRDNVSIYYKVLSSTDDLDDPSDFTEGWTKYPVSTTTSAYSTMILKNDGSIPFLYEENSANSGYDIQFQDYSLSTITNGAYAYSSELLATPALLGTTKTTSSSGDTDSGDTDDSSTEPTATPSTDQAAEAGYPVTAPTEEVSGTVASQTGVTISLDGNNGHVLYSEGAGGNWTCYFRHNIAPIQIVCANDTCDDGGSFGELSSNGTGLFSEMKNDMLMNSSTNNLIQLANWTNHCKATFFAIIAPKGYKFSRYQMDINTESAGSGAEIEEISYNGTTPDLDNPLNTFELGTESSEKYDVVKSNGSNVLYFRVKFADTSAHSITFNSLKLTFNICEPFTASLPMGNGKSKAHTGVIDLGTFGYNANSKWTFNSANVTDLQDVTVGSATSTLTPTLVDDKYYYPISANGTYYVEAPKKFRVTGATLHFLGGVSTTTSTSSSTTTTYETTSSVSDGYAYLIGSGDGHYLSLNGTTVVDETDPSKATKWTFSAYSSYGFYISNNGYYLYPVYNSTTYAYELKLTSTQSYNYWYYSNGYLSWNNGHDYLRYDNGWVVGDSYLPTYYSENTTTTTTPTTTGPASYTASLYDRSGSTITASASLSSDDPSADLYADGFNNDAVRFDISNLSGTAYFTVDLKMLPLDGYLTSVEAAYQNTDGQVMSAAEGKFTDFKLNDGNTTTVVVPAGSKANDDDKYQIVFRNALNENRTSWYGSAKGNEECNYYLVGSNYENKACGTDVACADKVNALQAGTVEIPFSNIASVNATDQATQIVEYDFSKSSCNYETVALADGGTETVYIYSADRPVWNLKDADHVAYRYYMVPLALRVATDEPVVELKNIYTSTLKGPNFKTNKRIANETEADTEHYFVGVKVTAKDSQTGYASNGYLSSSAIISAIKKKMASAANTYENDVCRTILYVDLTGINTINDDGGWDDFNTLTADNCLYFMPSGTSAAGRENTIVKQADGGFESAGDVRLYDQQPFFTPYAFSTGTHYALYQRTISGNNNLVKNATLIMPYAITLDGDSHPLTATDAKNITLTFWNLTGTEIQSVSKASVICTKVAKSTTTKDAYTPFHVTYTPEEEGKNFELNVQNAEFAATPDPSEQTEYTACHNEWTAHATFTGAAIPLADYRYYYTNDLYFKSSELEGYTAFRLRPFRSYYTTTGDNSAKEFQIVFDENDEDVDDENDDELTSIKSLNSATTLILKSGRGSISAKAVKDTLLNVYDLMGRNIISDSLSAGTQNSYTLSSGIYIINGKKVIVK